MTDDLKTIKKLYGEKMMHFCRDFFSSILEEQGLLPNLLQDNFAESHLLYVDLEENNVLNEFKNYIFDLFYKKDKKNEKTSIDLPTPKELMFEAGYELFECITEEDIQAFKKYYDKYEELCTFQEHRLESCYVFFAVKKNIDEINREDYPKPKRQDEYGTSVISIQFSRDESHHLSIKNRYNHTVLNPDATFSNNLDNITQGLTDSFAIHYGLEQKNKNNRFDIPGYTRANDGKWYKFNYEEGRIYYCPNNIIIDNGEVKKYDKEKYLIMDYFILDLVNKEIIYYNIDDSFSELVGEIKKITIVNKENKKTVTIINTKEEQFIITLDKSNHIIDAKTNIEYIPENILMFCFYYTDINLIVTRQFEHDEEIEKKPKR